MVSYTFYVQGPLFQKLYDEGTSKAYNPESLGEVSSFGFRGEGTSYTLTTPDSYFLSTQLVHLQRFLLLRTCAASRYVRVPSMLVEHGQLFSRYTSSYACPSRQLFAQRVAGWSISVQRPCSSLEARKIWYSGVRSRRFPQCTTLIFWRLPLLINSFLI